MNGDLSNRARSGATRRLLFGANTAMALLLAALLLAMANYLAARHHQRFDWSRSHAYELSAKSRSLLAGLSNRVDVILFFRPGHALYRDAEALLREYEFACPRLRIEHVDPDREQARATEVVRQFGLTKPNVIVFAMNDRHRIVTDLELVELDTSGMESGLPPRRTGFRGEQACSTALLQISDPVEPVVYFVSGHGERDPRNFDKYEGYSGIANSLTEDHIDVRSLQLGASNAIPQDASAVVIAGPLHKFSPAEIEAVRQYLARSGRLLVTLENSHETGLRPLLREWGVRVGEGHVVDTGHSLSGIELFLDAYAPHPITASLTNVTVVMYLPRPLGIVEDASGGADKPHVVPLLQSGATSWAEMDTAAKTFVFDTGREQRGPLTIAMAVEKGQVAGVDMDIRPTRIVVFGDTDFASNGSLVGGNPDLFRNAVNWLLERKDLIAVSAKPIDTIRLIMNQRQLNLLFWCLVVVTPALAALAGVLVALRRRH